MNMLLKSVPPPVAARPADTYSDLHGLASLKRDPGSPQAMHAVAEQIDALFLQMMLKSMRDATAEVGGSGSNEMGMYQDMFDKQIALSLSQHQGLGLGAQLTRQLPTASAVPSPSGGAPSMPAAPRAAVQADAHGGAQTVATATAGDFVDKVFPSIQRAAATLGVSPLALLAQAALETGWGRRMARSADGSSSHNLFGIKADDKWAGARVAADTVEFSGGIATQRRTAFRAYDSVADSVDDFARLLASSPRYREAMAGGANPWTYAEGMGKSGYATDPEYASKLKGILGSSTFRSLVARRGVNG